MIEPQKYTATVKPSEPPDVFTGKRRVVTGYYVKHLAAQPYPISTKEEHDEFVEKHTEHYIFCSGFADWGLSTDLEQWEIDPTTLEEVAK